MIPDRNSPLPLWAHELHARCGLWPDAGWERLRPELPAAEQRELLGLGARTPVLAIERLASSHGTPVEWRHGLVNADRFSYVARWAAQDLGAGFELAGSPGTRPASGTYVPSGSAPGGPA